MNLPHVPRVLSDAFRSDNLRECLKHVMGHFSASIGEAESVVDFSNTLAVTSSLMHQWTSIEIPDRLYLGMNWAKDREALEDEMKAVRLGTQNPNKFSGHTF